MASSESKVVRNYLCPDPTEHNAIISYCRLKRSLDAIDQQFAPEKKAMVTEKKIYVERLKTFMNDRKLSCVPVQIQDSSHPDQKITGYLKYRVGFSLSPFQDNTLRDSVQSITENDLKCARNRLIEDSVEPPTVSRVWKEAIEDRLRTLLSKENVTFSLSMAKPKKKAIQEIRVPPEIQEYAQTLYDLQTAMAHQSKQVKKLKEQKGSEYPVHEDIIIDFMHKFEPSKRSQRIRMGNQASRQKETRFLRLKERRRLKPIRFKAIKPVIADVVEDVTSSFPDVDEKNAAFREALISALETQYSQLKEDSLQIFEELTLDRGRTEAPQTGDDEFDDDQIENL